MARKKRLNVVKSSAHYSNGDGDISEHFMDQVEEVLESQELEGNEVHVEQQDNGSLNMSGENATAKKRGRTTLTHIWDLPVGNRIVVKCNKLGQPIGAEGGLLGKFLGTVARNEGYCPLNLKDWRMVKKDGGAETILQFAETKFLYPYLCEKWILKSTGRDWRRYKASLKKTYFNAMNNGRVLDQQNRYEDDDMSFSTEKHDNYANQQLLQCHEAPSSQWSARSFPQQEQEKFQKCMNNIQDQVIRNKTPHHVPSKKTRPSPMEVGSTVLLLSAKYPNKDQVAYASLLSCNPSTKVGSVELGNQFWKVRINHSLRKTEALVRPLDCCKSIDDAHAKGMPIAWPSICVRKING